MRHSAGLFSYFPQLFSELTAMKIDDSNKKYIITSEILLSCGK